MRIIQSVMFALMAFFGLSMAQLRGNVATDELLISGSQPFLPPPIVIHHAAIAQTLSGISGIATGVFTNVCGTSTNPITSVVFGYVTDSDILKTPRFALCDGMSSSVRANYNKMVGPNYYNLGAVSYDLQTIGTTTYATNIRYAAPTSVPTASPTFLPTATPTKPTSKPTTKPTIVAQTIYYGIYAHDLDGKICGNSDPITYAGGVFPAGMMSTYVTININGPSYADPVTSYPALCEGMGSAQWHGIWSGTIGTHTSVQFNLKTINGVQYAYNVASH